MNYSTAYADLIRQHDFSEHGASNALYLANELGTVRFGNLRITSWGDGSYELRTAYLIAA